MAAGLGFKTFNTGDVLSAADVNGYLMQGVLVFADATARDAAITSPQEGQFAYTKNNDSLWYYSGSAWVASGATGDIEGVTAGTGISGGGTSGTVTITNSMATAIDAKGDLVVGTGADTFSRLAVGTNNYVLTADSTQATGLKWAAASSGGGETLISTTSLTSGSGVALTSIAGTYKHLRLEIVDAVASTELGIELTFNSDTGTNYDRNNIYNSGSGGNSVSWDQTSFQWGVINSSTTSSYKTSGVVDIYNYANTTYRPIYGHTLSRYASTGANRANINMGRYRGSSAITRIDVDITGGTFSAGTLYFYGIS